MPADLTLYPGALLIFAGRRWKVTAVDHAHKIIEAVPAPGGRPPRFNGGIAGVHARLRAEMRSVLAAEHVPSYLSDTAASLLSEARATYTRYQLGDRSILQAGPHALLVPWTGSKAVTTLTAQLCSAGLDAGNDGLIITVASVAVDHIRQCLGALVAAGPADPVVLAVTVANKEAAKYDEWIDDELLAIDYARRALDTDGAWRTAKTLLADAQPTRPSERKPSRPRELNCTEGLHRTAHGRLRRNFRWSAI
jgi:ATP-dependent helicase Lhr and Lhr-like helicase